MPLCRRGKSRGSTGRVCHFKMKKYDIDSDGKTVWVNSSDGVCIGRFGRFGVDVHHDLKGQMDSGSQCLFCTHTPPGAKEWHQFQEAMAQHHEVFVSEHYRPSWLLDY